MSKLPERLRDIVDGPPSLHVLCKEAADHIDELHLKLAYREHEIARYADAVADLIHNSP